MGCSRQGDDGLLGILRSRWHSQTFAEGRNAAADNYLPAGHPRRPVLQSRVDLDWLAADRPQRRLHRRDYEAEHTYTRVGL